MSAPPGAASVESVTAVALAAAGAAESPAGQSALVLARRIDAGVDTGSGLASLSRAHAERLADALSGARAAGNPLDELRAARERKRAAG